MGDEVRTEHEVAAMRASAEVAAGQGPYRATVAAAVTDTLDWIADGGPSPLEQWLDGPRERRSNYRLRDAQRVDGPPDDGRRNLERMRGEDAEQAELRAGGAGTTSVYPGVVAHTLQWFRRAPYAEPPLL